MKQPKLVLVPHNMGSRSAKLLADTLGKKVGHKVFRVKPTRVRGRKAWVLQGGTDKLTQMERFKANNVSAPEFTRDTALARQWCADGPVVSRTILNGSEGRGIHIADDAASLVAAPLYTRYIKKKKEYRVHVLNGEVIDVQEKRLRKEFSGQRDNRVRNLANGYVFCRDNVVEPAGLRDLAVQATRALGYTLGAVDIVFNEHHAKLYVLEVNACPGMQGTTLERYADKIVNWYRS